MRAIPSNPPVDYSEYLLHSPEDFARFRSRMGSLLEPTMASVRTFLKEKPNDAWIDYLKGVPKKNIPVIIGCICLYIQEYDFVKENIDFNKTATMIRYRRHQWHNLNDLPTHEKYREKMQNNGSPEQ